MVTVSYTLCRYICLRPVLLSLSSGIHSSEYLTQCKKMMIKYIFCGNLPNYFPFCKQFVDRTNTFANLLTLTGLTHFCCTISLH